MKVISTFTQSSVQTLSLAKWIYPTPSHYVSWRPISILSSHLPLDLIHGFLSSGFPWLQFCMHHSFTPLWWLSYIQVPQDMNIYPAPGVYTLGKSGGRPFSNAHIHITKPTHMMWYIQVHYRSLITFLNYPCTNGLTAIKITADRMLCTWFLSLIMCFAWMCSGVPSAPVCFGMGEKITQYSKKTSWSMQQSCYFLQTKLWRTFPFNVNHNRHMAL